MNINRRGFLAGLVAGAAVAFTRPSLAIVDEPDSEPTTIKYASWGDPKAAHFIYKDGRFIKIDPKKYTREK